MNCYLKLQQLCYSQITCTQFGHCHKMIRIIPHVGGASKPHSPNRGSKAAERLSLDQKVVLIKANKESGSDDSLNTPVAMKKIYSAALTTFMSTRSNTNSSSVSAIGSGHRFTDTSGRVITIPLGAVRTNGTETNS